MPRFISLSKFKSLYEDQSQLLTEEGFTSFMTKLRSNEGKTVASMNGINDYDLMRFTDSLSNSQLIVFHGWVEQNPDLLSFLEGKEIQNSFEDKKFHLKHQWGEEFRRFVSPFVVDRLLKESTEDILLLAKLFSYVDLIVSDDRAVVEAELFKPIKRRLDEVDDANSIAEEQALIEFIKPLCDDEIIVVINHLSKGSYNLKLEYVDAILSAIRAKGCTVRFANWILKKMEEVKLNNEHEYKLSDLRKELKSGELKVRNHGEGRTPIRWKSLITTIIILGLGYCAFYIIYYKPFNEVEEPETVENASFKKFSVEERKAIDSLLQVMNDDDFTGDFEVDPGVLSGGGSVIALRSEFKNDLMERIFDDVNKDANLKDYYATDSCATSIKFQRYPGVKDLAKKKGNIESVIRNESEYDVIVYVTSSSNSGDVHSFLLKKQETASFKMNHYDIITTVAGNAYRNFNAPKRAEEDEIPSMSFKKHFCDTDANYYESVNTSLQLMHVSKGTAKFMVMGDHKGTYRLIDVYSVMEEY